MVKNKISIKIEKYNNISLPDFTINKLTTKVLMIKKPQILKFKKKT